MATTNLKIFREVYNHTQEEIASMLGISQNTYSRIERNPKNLTAEQAQKLAEFYNVSIADLLSETAPTLSFTDNKIGNNGYVNSIENDNHVSANISEITSLKEEIAFLRKQNEELMKLLADKK